MRAVEPEGQTMSQSLTITTPDGAFEAYVATPAKTPAPALVVIQEIFGVNPGMRQICDELAADGFLAVCPDLFWRFEPGLQLSDHSEADWKKALDFYTRYDLDAGVRDIAATITAARGLPESTGKVGVMGFCLGGLMTYLSAARTDLDAAVSYYGGSTETHLEEARKVHRPLMLHLAEEDEFITKDAQKSIRGALGGRPGVTIYSYPGRHHAFARPGGDHYDAADAATANGRTREFFTAHLS